MDTLNHYRDLVENLLAEVAAMTRRYQHFKDHTVFDRNSDNYLVVREGWDKSRRIHGIVVHIEIRGGKIWIQEDGVEHGIAADLEASGIPKSDIVLGFQPPNVRPHTGYAA
jgi:hypothetical protein